jgi:hypothetical protein
MSLRLREPMPVALMRRDVDGTSARREVMEV